MRIAPSGAASGRSNVSAPAAKPAARRLSLRLVRRRRHGDRAERPARRTAWPSMPERRRTGRTFGEDAREERGDERGHPPRLLADLGRSRAVADRVEELARRQRGDAVQDEGPAAGLDMQQLEIESQKRGPGVARRRRARLSGRVPERPRVRESPGDDLMDPRVVEREPKPRRKPDDREHLHEREKRPRVDQLDGATADGEEQAKPEIRGEIDVLVWPHARGQPLAVQMDTRGARVHPFCERGNRGV